MLDIVTVGQKGKTLISFKKGVRGCWRHGVPCGKVAYTRHHVFYAVVQLPSTHVASSLRAHEPKPQSLLALCFLAIALILSRFAIFSSILHILKAPTLYHFSTPKFYQFPLKHLFNHLWLVAVAGRPPWRPRQAVRLTYVRFTVLWRLFLSFARFTVLKFVKRYVVACTDRLAKHGFR